ncbi:MAG TPA: beta-propeller fold lactonase family protein [Propionibacteriaceae bacterium]|nr:beta-propeller fold lactonase family protein [Propionibacteriaceae bacterium]
MSELVLIANAGDATISAFVLADDTLRPLATTALSGSCSTFAVDADRDLVYAAVKGEPPAILTLSLDRAAGVLTQVGRADCGPVPAYVDLAPGGGALLGASYHAGVGTVWPLTDGRLGEAVALIAHPNLHCVITTSTGSNAYFVSLGADLVAQYSLSATGHLTPLDPPTVAAPAGSGARHLTLSADQRSAYLVTEYSGEVIRLDRDAETGVLTPAEKVSIVNPDAALTHSRFGADPRAEHLIWGADVHVGRGFVLATERSASTLASISMDADGHLGRVVDLCPTEQQPRGFAVTNDGTRAVVVGELSTSVTLHGLGPDGQISVLDRVETGRGANWVRVLPLG